MKGASITPTHLRLAMAIVRARMFFSDIKLMWGDVDWFMAITGAVLYVAAVVVIVCGMLAIASVVSPADLERVLAVIGGAL